MSENMNEDHEADSSALDDSQEAIDDAREAASDAFPDEELDVPRSTPGVDDEEDLED